MVYRVRLSAHKDILRQLKAGQSVRNVSKIVGKGISTVQRVKPRSLPEVRDIQIIN
jgi:hypothetical protein